MEHSMLEVLNKFNIKAMKIIESHYVSNLVNGKISLSLRRDGFVIADPEVTVPDELYIDSLLLSLRFFIQDNEPISIRNLNSLYSKSDIDNSFKLRFDESRKWLLLYLDGKCVVEENGVILTRREVFERFVYGEHAHSTKEKQYDELKKNNKYFSINKYDFNEVLLMYIKVIKEIVLLNKEVISRYEGQCSFHG